LQTDQQAATTRLDVTAVDADGAAPPGPATRVASRQTYTHLELGDGYTRVRYAAGSFTSDLVVDGAGLVVDYPTMARRMDP
jgi:hypothetical protein